MNNEALPETGLAVERFWDGLGAIVRGFAPRNRKLLDLRDTLQARIDEIIKSFRNPQSACLDGVHETFPCFAPGLHPATSARQL
jgi:malate synthase